VESSFHREPLSVALLLSFISKVDVLKILVRANYRPIPSLEDLLETPAVTRLRNQLLEAEHYQLAVEVGPGLLSSPPSPGSPA
jgi:hypothetical protein